MRGITRKIDLVELGVLAILVAGCAGVPSGPPPHSTDPVVSQSPFPSATPSPSRARSPFASLAGYLAHRSGQVTAALYDRRTGRTWVLHAGVRGDTASIVNVQI